MKLRCTDNEYRPIESALFTDSAAFDWLIVVISLAFGIAAGLLVPALLG
jgi:hypothetical protein